MAKKETKTSSADTKVQGEEQLNKQTKEMTDGDQVRENGELGKESKKKKKNKSKKKRTAEDLDSKEAICASAEIIHEQPRGEYDMNEPTMAEKLSSLDLVDDEKSKTTAKLEPTPIGMPPRADSVHLLVKQALHADDHSLLLDCLYTRDEKVIAKSTSLLNPADVLKLLKSLTSMIQLRGAVLVCALPWIRSLLSQHASSIASQESSLLILNSLYQLIESRISTFGSALQLSTTLDVLSATIPDDEEVEESSIPALIYEDKDSDEEEEEEEDAMETDEDDVGGEDLREVIDIPYDFDGSDLMSD